MKANKEKLNKKAKRAENAKNRNLWQCCPISKIIPNKKKNHKENINIEDY